MPKGLVRRTGACSPASSLVSLPVEVTPSPQKKLRRVHSDRFDQLEYERSVASLLEDDSPSGVCADEEHFISTTSEDRDGDDESWTASNRPEQAVLRQDEEATILRRVIDRNVLIVGLGSSVRSRPWS